MSNPEQGEQGEESLVERTERLEREIAELKAAGARPKSFAEELRANEKVKRVPTPVTLIEGGPKTPISTTKKLVAAALFGLLAVGFFAVNQKKSDSVSSVKDRRGVAFEACKEFVRKGLKSPSSAKFRNFYEEDGEVTVAVSGNEYTVVSTVDADNSYGSNVRNVFTCTVRSEGADWRLINLDM